MNSELLEILFSYFKIEVDNKIDFANDGLVIDFDNGKKIKVEVKNI